MVYLLYFYYQNPDEREESPCDKEFTFKEWEDREQVSHYIKQTLINVSLWGELNRIKGLLVEEGSLDIFRQNKDFRYVDVKQD